MTRTTRIFKRSIAAGGKRTRRNLKKNTLRKGGSRNLPARMPANRYGLASKAVLMERARENAMERKRKAAEPAAGPEAEEEGDGGEEEEGVNIPVQWVPRGTLTPTEPKSFFNFKTYPPLWGGKRTARRHKKAGKRRRTRRR